MLKAKDLRCGNCIYWLLPEGTEKQIIVISAIGAVSNTITYGHGDVANLNVCEPIPLTPEIFEQLQESGFLIEHDCVSYILNDERSLSLEIFPDGKFGICGFKDTFYFPNKVNYLHQLQNLIFA